MDDPLKRLGEAANEQSRLEDEIETKVLEVAELVKKLRVVSEETIPSLMDEAGFSETPRLSDGTKILIDQTLRASTAVKGKHFPKIIEWLKSSGNADIIKNQISVQLGTGQIDEAEKARRALVDLGLSPEQAQAVNNQTFCALLREMMEDGEDVPLDDLGAFVQRVASLERPDGTTSKKKLAALKKLQKKADK